MNLIVFKNGVTYNEYNGKSWRIERENEDFEWHPTTTPYEVTMFELMIPHVEVMVQEYREGLRPFAGKPKTFKV